MGGILESNGINGFLGNLDELYAQSDAEGQTWQAFIHEWHAQHGSKVVGVTKLYEIVCGGTDRDPVDVELGNGNELSRRTVLGKLQSRTVTEDSAI